MTEKMRLALGILAASVVLGLLGNWLLWAPDWGINVGLWIAVAVGAAIGLQRWRATGRLDNPWALGAAVFFALAFAWRDSSWLRTLDVMVLGVALTLPFWRPVAGRLSRSLIGDAVIGACGAAAHAVRGWVFALDPEIKWAEVGRGGAWRHGVGVLLGGALAVPLLLIFGGLFMAADPQFDHLVRGLFHFNAEDWFGRGFVIAWLAWGTGGFLFGLLSDPGATRAARTGWAMGTVPIATALVLLDVLFGAFVALQLPYLFGGVGLVIAREGLTFAEYARHGFFELVMVTTLALPMLLALHGLLGEPTAQKERVFRWLAGVMLVLLAVIIASAAQRMWLYQDQYGWTTARLFVLAFEFWLGGVLVWFAATVLRDRRPAFLFGAIAWGMVATAALHLPNWEAMIVRHNVALADQGRPVDVNYFSQLSLDAVPALTEALPTFQGETGRRVAHQLHQARKATLAPDWRSWRWAQWGAHAALADKGPELEALTRPVYGPPSPYVSYGRYGRDGESYNPIMDD